MRMYSNYPSVDHVHFRCSHPLHDALPTKFLSRDTTSLQIITPPSAQAHTSFRSSTSNPSQTQTHSHPQSNPSSQAHPPTEAKHPPHSVNPSSSTPRQPPHNHRTYLP